MGIDPGQSGGIAVISEIGEAWLERMPQTERDTSDAVTMWTNQDNVGTSIQALIERVHSMPKQGVSSTFKFGQNYGFLRACLIGARIPFQEITAAQWQGKLRCRTGGKKNVTKQLAQQFPELLAEDIDEAMARATQLEEVSCECVDEIRGPNNDFTGSASRDVFTQCPGFCDSVYQDAHGWAMYLTK